MKSDVSATVLSIGSLRGPEQAFAWATGSKSGSKNRAGLRKRKEPGAQNGNPGYHVFLTPSGDSNGLYVSTRTATGFTVREQRDGTSNLAFDYRVVARRKDVEAPRLAKVTLPEAASHQLASAHKQSVS